MRTQWLGRYIPTIFLTCAIYASDAYGQTATGDVGTKQAMTQKFFERGAQAMADKRYPEACGLFEKVIELAPNGIGGHEALGQCYRQIGRLGSAWAQYTVAETLALAIGDKQRAEMLNVNAQDLEPRVATVTIHVPKTFKYMEGIRILMDDVLEEKVLWGTPRPVDVGTHVIKLEAPGQAPWSKEIKIEKDGLKQDVVIRPDIVRPAPPVVEYDPKPMRPTTNWRQRLGWVGIGLGGTSLVAAGILASLAVGTQNASMDSGHCPTIDQCDQGGLAMRKQAQSLADGTTATFVVGSVLAGTGIILVLTAPKDAKEQERSGKTAGLSLNTTISPMGFGLQGTW